ncbi:type II secretion system protein GspL [Chitiniphilus eburneus]|uniref:type II secretion system protein GspL n=1 Tax=Chitiniphilus eburneus TaxID=2571148 RepID=UPI00145E28A6|nr:type II secretion system protein GspL [Chitiniphilus eburneus]
MSVSTQSLSLRLLLDADPDSNQPLSWFLVDGAGRTEQSGSAPIERLPAATRLELLISPARVSAHVIPLPRQPQAKLRALLPLALEDKLLTPAATLHFALLPLGDDRWRVFAVERAWLKHWLDRLSTAGRSVEAAYPLASLLAPDPEAWLRLALPDGAVLLVSPEGETALFDDGATADLVAADQPMSVLALREACGGPLRNAANLLQGELTPGPSWRFDWRPWRRAGVLALLLLILVTTVNLADWARLSQREKALKREMRQTFAAAFPGVPVVDPALQLASRLREAGIADGATATQAGDLPAVLQKLDALGGAQLRLTRIALADGKLEIEVTGDASALQKQLADAGMTFELAGEQHNVLRRQE